jgi:hypothetical protein
MAEKADQLTCPLILSDEACMTNSFAETGAGKKEKSSLKEKGFIEQ